MVLVGEVLQNIQDGQEPTCGMQEESRRGTTESRSTVGVSQSGSGATQAGIEG